jgi:hypothetical protein
MPLISGIAPLVGPKAASVVLTSCSTNGRLSPYVSAVDGAVGLRPATGNLNVQPARP